MRKLLKAGLVVTCVGDSGSINYKKSKEENTLINNVVEHILKYSDYDYSIRDFSVMGSDERQYCSPGFNFPVGSLMRTPYKEYKEYHTSLDNKNIISFPAMEEMVNLYIDVFKAIELNRKYRVNQLFCELHLSKYDLYMDLGKQTMRGFEIDDLLHFLSYADGSMELLEIAEKKKKSIFNFETIVKICLEKNLIHFVY